jgi:hypothetical protein
LQIRHKDVRLVELRPQFGRHMIEGVVHLVEEPYYCEAPWMALTDIRLLLLLFPVVLVGYDGVLAKLNAMMS